MNNNDPVYEYLKKLFIAHCSPYIEKNYAQKLSTYCPAERPA